MENENFEELTNKELLEIYNIIKDFLKYLDKEKEVVNNEG